LRGIDPLEGLGAQRWHPLIKKKEGCTHPSSFADQAQSVHRSECSACGPIRPEQAHLPLSEFKILYEKSGTSKVNPEISRV
jgi:hypothetical protein